MEKKIKLLPPIMPNFISIQTSIRPRQDGGFSENYKIPIQDLSIQEAEEYGELMKQTFIQHYIKKHGKTINI